jgi:hypothetical protein
MVDLYVFVRRNKNVEKFSLLRYAVIFIILAAIAFTTTFADEPVKGGKEDVQKYKFRIKYPGTIPHVYEMSDTTEVKMFFSDSTVKSYKREIFFWFTLKPPNTESKDGFVLVELSIDSMSYRFLEGDKEYKYRSGLQGGHPLRFDDFEYFSIPHGQQFNMTYTPYGDIGKIEGERLDEMRDYIKEQSSNSTDIMKKFMWTQGLSDNRLKFIVDARKIQFSDSPVAMDSVWFTPFLIQLDGITFYNEKTEASLKEVRGGFYTIEANIKQMYPVLDAERFYDINEPMPMNNVDVKGTYGLLIGPKSTLEQADAHFEASLIILVKKEVIKETISSNQHWKLLGRYTW